MYGKASAKINQDRGFITYPLAGDQQMVFCVYDGHGSNGEQVSEFLMLKVPDLLEEDPQKSTPDGPSERSCTPSRTPTASCATRRSPRR